MDFAFLELWSCEAVENKPDVLDCNVGIILAISVQSSYKSHSIIFFSFKLFPILLNEPCSQRLIWGEMKRKKKNPLTKPIKTTDCSQTWNILVGCAKQTTLFVVCFPFVCLTLQARHSVASDWHAQGRPPFAVRRAQSQCAGPQSSTQLYVTLFIGWQTRLCWESYSVLEGSKNKKKQQKQRAISNPLIHRQLAACFAVKAQRKTFSTSQTKTGIKANEGRHDIAESFPQWETAFKTAGLNGKSTNKNTP